MKSCLSTNWGTFRNLLRFSESQSSLKLGVILSFRFFSWVVNMWRTTWHTVDNKWCIFLLTSLFIHKIWILKNNEKKKCSLSNVWQWRVNMVNCNNDGPQWTTPFAMHDLEQFPPTLTLGSCDLFWPMRHQWVCHTQRFNRYLHSGACLPGTLPLRSQLPGCKAAQARL